MSPATSFAEALAGLEARGYGIKPGLERMEQLVRLLDNPQLTYPTVHIAGTNGKTSTAQILGAILAAHGTKTGVYISPHLQSIRERYVLLGLIGGKIASSVISEEDFAATLGYLAPYIELIEGGPALEAAPASDPMSVTYFEVATLAAFEWMAEKAVSAGVYEAGMGGRWDATNLIQAEVAILTPVGVDHTDYLGSTPLEQAGEKVGIVKMGSSVVSGPQLPEVLELVERTAASRDATLSLFGRDFRIVGDEPGVGGRLVSISTRYGSYRDLFLPLYGPHQAQNLSLAVAAAEAFSGGQLDDASLRLALETLKIPGRLERVGRTPLVLLDGAHNTPAAKALAASLQEAFQALSVTMVVTLFKDKDIEGVLGNLAPLANRLIVTRSSSSRAQDPKELAAVASRFGVSATVVEPLERALDEAIGAASSDSMVLVTGSLYGVGQARTHLMSGSESNKKA